MWFGGEVEGTISGNTIGTAGDLGSGSESSNAITLGLKGAGTNTIAVTNNTIREWGTLDYTLNHRNAQAQSGGFDDQPFKRAHRSAGAALRRLANSVNH